MTAVVVLLARLAGGGIGEYLLTKTSADHDRPPTLGFYGTLRGAGNCLDPSYSDLRTGTRVVVTDEHRVVLAAVPLVPDGPCTWTFEIRNVPAGRSLYYLTVAHRGIVGFTEAQLRETDGVHLNV